MALALWPGGRPGGPSEELLREDDGGRAEEEEAAPPMPLGLGAPGALDRAALPVAGPLLCERRPAAAPTEAARLELAAAGMLACLPMGGADEAVLPPQVKLRDQALCASNWPVDPGRYFPLALWKGWLPAPLIADSQVPEPNVEFGEPGPSEVCRASVVPNCCCAQPARLKLPPLESFSYMPGLPTYGCEGRAGRTALIFVGGGFK